MSAYLLPLKEVGHFTVQDMEKMTTGCWDPHHHNEIVTAIDADLVGYDLRSCQKTFKLEKAHPPCARDIDYNPNRPYYFVSCGDDCLIKFWDYRKVAEPLKTLGGHYHWVWSVKYNRYHDQLILSCSSDNLVNLWNVSSLSSAPFGGDTDLDGKNKASSSADCLVKTFDDHEDSVYTVSWSSSDAWIFASTSYDGRVAINHVPSAEKYKILL